MITHNIYDKFLKEYVSDYADCFLIQLEYDFRVEDVLPTEFINEYKENRMDYVVMTNKNIIIDFEFHSSQLKDDDVRRYTKYAYIIGENYKLDVLTFVISTYDTRNYIKIFKIHEDASHPIYIHSLKTIDGDKIFRKLIEKHENKEKLNKKDISELALLPFYGSKYPIEEVLYNVVVLTNNLNFDMNNEEDKKNFLFLKYSQAQFLNHFVKDKFWQDKLIKVFDMGRDPFKEIVMEIYNSEMKKSRLEGIEEGKSIAKEEVNKSVLEIAKEEVDKSVLEIAKNMINKNFSKKDIMECTKITEKQFLALLKV